MVIDKPAGLLTLPDRYKPELPNVYDILQSRKAHYLMVHRLDKETSGLLLLAKDEDVHRSLNKMFEERRIDKTYLALVEGALSTPRKVETLLKRSGTGSKMIVSTSDGKIADTSFTPEENYHGWTLVKVKISTGRTHQIRVHAAHIGHPLVADRLYGNGRALTIVDIKRLQQPPKRETALMRRTALHSYQLSFVHPVSRNSMTFEAPLPKDFKASINQLRKWRSKTK